MEVCAISPFLSAPSSVVLGFLKTCTADLVMLPGAAENSPEPLQVQRVLSPGVTAFVEGKEGKTEGVPYLVTCRSIISMPTQVFCKKPSARDMDFLVDAVPKRTFRIGTKKVTFLLCGEIIAFNPDGTVKHNRRIEYDVIANPAHSIMGHWNHLGSKLEKLSLHSVEGHAN